MHPHHTSSTANITEIRAALSYVTLPVCAPSIPNSNKCSEMNFEWTRNLLICKNKIEIAPLSGPVSSSLLYSSEHLQTSPLLFGKVLAQLA